MRKPLIQLACMLLLPLMACGKAVESRARQTASIVLSDSIDLHLTAPSRAIAAGVTIDLNSTAAWLFLDSIKPNTVLRQYAGNIRIGGQPLEADANARVVVYRHGAVVIPHSVFYFPITVD